MAHVGSEVERALNWKAKNNLERSAKAFDRALELLDLTLDCPRNRPRLKEIARAREVCVDFFRVRINLPLPGIPCENIFCNSPAPRADRELLSGRQKSDSRVNAGIQIVRKRTNSKSVREITSA